MFNGAITKESVVEALNFSFQTITTVGYGNWVPANVAANDQRVFLVKILSLPFMLVGGGIFAVIVGIVANRLSR